MLNQDLDCLNHMSNQDLDRANSELNIISSLIKKKHSSYKAKFILFKKVMEREGEGN